MVGGGRAPGTGVPLYERTMPLSPLLKALLVLPPRSLSIVRARAHTWACAHLHCGLCFFLCGPAAGAFPLATPQAPRIITGPTPVLPPTLRNPAPVTTPTIMPLIRQIQSSALVPGANPHPALVQQGPESGIIYTPYEYPYTLTPSILEYPIDSTGVLGMSIPEVLHSRT